MRKVLLSIKPKFVKKIKSGDKRFEYRRKIFKDSSVDTILIYSSSPVRRVVAECKIKQIHSGSISEIWNKTSSYSGISEDFYRSYFKDLDTAFAVEMIDVEFFEEPKMLSDYNISRAPQSFCYVE